MFEGRDWFAAAGASPKAIQQLRALAPAGLPERYLDLLTFSNGGEGPLPVDPFTVCLDSAEDVLERLFSAEGKAQNADGFLIFGGNGGGEYLAFSLTGGSPWPVVTIDMVAGPESAEIVAPDFETFLELIGFKESEQG